MDVDAAVRARRRRSARRPPASRGSARSCGGRAAAPPRSPATRPKTSSSRGAQCRAVERREGLAAAATRQRLASRAARSRHARSAPHAPARLSAVAHRRLAPGCGFSAAATCGSVRQVGVAQDEADVGMGDQPAPPDRRHRRSRPGRSSSAVMTSQISFRLTSATVTPALRPSRAIASVMYGSDSLRK